METIELIDNHVETGHSIRICAKTRQLYKEMNLDQYSTLNSFSERWPLKKEVYTHLTGALLPRIIGEVFSELGFKAWINPSQGNGVDLEIYLDERTVFVVEVLNWSKGSRLTSSRLNNIIKNLNEHPCEKILIYTVLNPEDKEKLPSSDINIVEIGYQILPYDFYTWFEKKGEIEGRKPYASHHIKVIKYDIRERLRPTIEKLHIRYEK